MAKATPRTIPIGPSKPWHLSGRKNGVRPAIFIQPGGNSRSIFLDMARGWRDAGFDPLVIDLAGAWGANDAPPRGKAALSRAMTADVVHLVRDQHITHVVGMWANLLFMLTHDVDGAGRVRSIFTDLGVSHLAWWLDAPQWAHAGDARMLIGHDLARERATTHLINNAATAAEMTRVLGFGETIVFPLGVDTRVHAPHPEITPEFDLVVSCGPGDPDPTPLALAQLESDAPDVHALRLHAAERVLPKLAKVAARFGPHEESVAALLRGLLESQIEDRHTPLLDRADALARHDAGLKPALELLLARPIEWIDASMNIRRVEGWERAFTISWLSRRFRVATFGPGGATAAWLSRAENLGDLPYAQMSRAYARGHAALNVMRWQDDEGLNLKPFEITASGVACLCANRRGLGAFFIPESEIVAVDDPAHAARALRTLLDSPGRRAEIAQAGLERTRRDHTWGARVRSLVERPK